MLCQLSEKNIITMDGFDDAGVFFSDNFSESQSSEAGGSNQAIKKQLREFLRDFHAQGDFTFKYRDQIKNNYLRLVQGNCNYLGTYYYQSYFICFRCYFNDKQGIPKILINITQSFLKNFRVCFWDTM